MNLYEILQNSGRVGEGMTHFERLFAQKVGGGKINEIFGVPPLRYIGDGRPLTDYLISGNTVQDGTPTPENPVPVVGCGTDTAGEWTLPLTVNGTEYPIYLGAVPTTRRIKKLVLDGTESSWGNGTSTVYLPTAGDANAMLQFSTIVSSHYAYHSGGTSSAPNNSVYTNAGAGTAIWFKTDYGNDVNSFKAFLAQEYAAGTPVTVWYVLAEPETGIVNEPLMKIGDYADTISFSQAGMTIPTVSGENVLDVPTTVPPSEVWIRGRIKEV